MSLYMFSEDLILDVLSKIYEFLSKHNPSLMTQGNLKNKEAFVLTNDRVFKSINEKIKG